jgi:phosphatidylglycerol lysyltransferase
MLDFLGRSLEPVYGFRSLLAFKRKFQPEFQPLFMAYPDPVALPAIGIALARAYLPSLSMREMAAFARSLG